MSYSDPNHEERRALRSDLLDELNDCSFADLDNHQPVEDGELALERALEQWRESIIEPLGEVSNGPILERYIHEGLEWTWQKSYKNRAFAWCGAFMSWAWRESVNPTVRKKHFPSTYRLQQWAKDSPRIIEGLENARRGDIIVIGHKKAWGDHITIFERLDEDGYWSVEGNAFGEIPEGGERKEGVIRRWRAKSEIHSIYRPLEVDR